MMARSSAPLARPVCVINDLFCSPQTVNLEVVRKFKDMTYDNFVIKDVNGNVIFEVKEAFLTMHGRQVLADSMGYPIALAMAEPRFEII
ncbi:hypothetical protein L1049_008737 [Liquidambar formosana]|uniref:Uncharacterized protein n=1 Tax=Liquidambar formosana TaxID=63359 RepID=A0AAP0S9V9_LIQFO